MSMYDKNHYKYCKVISLQLIKINGKNKNKNPESKYYVLISLVQFSSVQSLTLCDPMNRSMPGLPTHPNSRRSLKPMPIESVIPSSHLILCHPLLLLPPIPPRIRVFSNESTLHIRWPKYWSFSFSISPSNEHPGLISFKMDWLDLLAVQGTLKSFLQHHIVILNIFVRAPFWLKCLLSNAFSFQNKIFLNNLKKKKTSKKFIPDSEIQDSYFYYCVIYFILSFRTHSLWPNYILISIFIFKKFESDLITQYS